MRSFLPCLLGLAAGACAYAPPNPAQQAEAQARLTKELAGRVPGKPMSCIPHTLADRDMVAISPQVVLFKEGGTVYRNDIEGGCNGLGSNGYTLVTRSHGTGLCQGDIAEVRDIAAGMMVGSCAFGPFTPYRRAR